MTRHAQARRAPAVTTAVERGRWLLFVHQLPSHPSNLRVSTWRRLQQIGAVPLRQSVYVLPDTASGREDFEWIKAEVSAAGGGASVFAAISLDGWSDDALVEEFRRTRQQAYMELAVEVEDVLRRAGGGKRSRRARAPAVGRLLDTFKARLSAIERIDFFGSAGRDRVLSSLAQLEARNAARSMVSAAAGGEAAIKEAFQGREWVTRPRPGVDRMASAWLIRRFIDPQARFGFAADRQSAPEGSVPFDMFGVEFSHRGDACTFETLCADFGLAEPALARLAAIVHDLDLKDGRYGASECPAVDEIIEGLQLAYEDDDALLAQGMTLFESLYRSFERHGRLAGPRPVVRSGTRGQARRRKRTS